MVIRLVKVALSASIALFAIFVAADNLIGCCTNFAFVQHVLGMDTIPPEGRRWGAPSMDLVLWRAGYVLIIAGEALMGMLFLIASIHLLHALRTGCPAAVALVRRGLAAVAALLFLLTVPVVGRAATLVLEDGARRLTFETADLLANPDAAELAVGHDPAYGGAPRRYRAVPVAALLSSLPTLAPGGSLEATAIDGFATQMPIELVQQSAGDTARAWLAVEPLEAPWPVLPHRQTSAGPFYLVWERPEASGISQELWPFQVATLRTVTSPAERWPQLAVDPSLPVDHAGRVGQGVFAANCLLCHRLNGAGTSDMGPDLNTPMSPTEYFQPSALRRYIRDPGALRTWPQRQMQGFTRDQISDYDLNAVVEYLDHMARRRLHRESGAGGASSP